jgi:CDP-4-dehydro-6-deoxyglucose reductase
MWQISTQFNQKFLQSDGQTILDAALNEGISIPYSCKSGRCSTCKCRLVSGQSKTMVDELGLTSEEKSQGFILSCVRSAASDLFIELDDLSDFGDKVIPVVKILPARISCIEKIGTDVLQVRLRLPPNTQFSFLAGQYIEVIGPSGFKRSYSLANAPMPDNQLQLHIRAVHGGVMSDYWFKQAKVNDLIRINGPLGSFFTRSLAGMHLVFLATGTGIAPIKAMLEQLSQKASVEKPLTASVYWGGRRPQDLYTDPREWYSNLQYVPVLSRAPDDWTGKRGHVQTALISDRPNLKITVVYACGSELMVQSAKSELILAGLPDRHFFSDAFVPSGS